MPWRTDGSFCLRQRCHCKIGRRIQGDHRFRKSEVGPPNAKLLIEGHCDERGTEEYNRSLGERRALALREALAKDGVDAGRIRTISYGKDQPEDAGHDEAAWNKNRRGVFVLCHPKPGMGNKLTLSSRPRASAAA